MATKTSSSCCRRSMCSRCRTTRTERCKRRVLTLAKALTRRSGVRRLLDTDFLETVGVRGVLCFRCFGFFGTSIAFRQTRKSLERKTCNCLAFENITFPFYPMYLLLSEERRLRREEEETRRERGEVRADARLRGWRFRSATTLSLALFLDAFHSLSTSSDVVALRASSGTGLRRDS